MRIDFIDYIDRFAGGSHPFSILYFSDFEIRFLLVDSVNSRNSSKESVSVLEYHQRILLEPIFILANDS